MRNTWPRGRSCVDVAGPAAAARTAAAAASPEDATYAELMATYAELGDILEHWNGAVGDPAEGAHYFHDRCRDHVERLIWLGRANDEHAAQRWATAWAAGTLDASTAKEED